MTSVSRLLQTILVAKIHGNPSNIHKVMTLCANWHSLRVNAESKWGVTCCEGEINSYM